jgi:hypothetical protein
MLDGIKREIAEKGYSEVMTVGLANLCFRSTNEKSSQQQLDKWCEVNGYMYEVFDGKDGRNRSCQWVRFSRQR